MALARIYDGSSFTLPAPITASVDGTLVVAAKGSIAPSSASLVMAATGFSSLSNETVLIQTVENDVGAQAHGIIATRLVGGADFGISINADITSSPEPANQLCVSVNGNVGIGKDPINTPVPGSLEISGGLYLASSVGTTPAANGTSPVVVACPVVTATSRVYFNIHTPAGTPGLPLVAARVPGVSFSFVSTDVADNSLYDYLVIG